MVTQLVQALGDYGMARRDQFHGKTEAELAGWLRRILANMIVDANRGGNDRTVKLWNDPIFD